MRVYIGPFRDDNESHNEWRPTEPFERDIRINIDDYDVWNMDTTLAMIIHPMLIKLKEIKNGHPCIQKMHKDAPCVINQDCNCNEEWNTILDKMIWSFKQQFDTSEEDQYYSGDLVWEDELIPTDGAGNVVPKEEATFFRMVKSPKDTFKIDTDGLTKHYERIQEGLDLFAKYYQSLWD